MSARLLFSKEDVNGTTDHLMRMARLAMYDRNVTHDKFVQLHSRFFQRTGASLSGSGIDRNNLRRRLLLKGTITFSQFKHVLLDILALDVTEIIVRVREEDGTIKTYSSKDRAGSPRLYADIFPEAEGAEISEDKTQILELTVKDDVEGYTRTISGEAKDKFPPPEAHFNTNHPWHQQKLLESS